MLLTNLRFSFRHLGRQKLNTTLHVIGLTLAMSVCLLIGLFLRYELGFDKHNEKAGRIYRVNSVFKESNKQFDLYATPIPLADAIRNEMTGVEKVAMTRAQFKSVVEINPQKLFKQEHILIVEPTFLDIFDIDLVNGNKSDLSKPYRALLNQTTAAKFFGREDPIGKTFKYRNKFIITVAGVFNDMPSNTHLPASILLSYVSNNEFLDNGDTWYFGDLAWTKLAASTYIVLTDNADIKNLQFQLKAIAGKNINSAPTLDKSIREDFEIQALTDIHFDTKRFRGGPWVAAVNTSWLWFFAGIGIVVLLLACINFLNLSTAQALTRAKEVGIRKTIGARRSQLLWQFLSEAFIITLISGSLAIVISQVSIPSLNTLLGKQITFNPLQSQELLIALLLFILLTGFLAGLYPAWLIAKFNPVTALKSGTTGTGINGTSLLRRTLVIVQFTISAGLLIAVLLMAQQAAFLRNTALGFEKGNIIRVEIGSHDKMQSFFNELMQIQGVEDVSFSRTTPISDDHWWNTMSETETGDRKSVCAIYGDDHFYSVYGLRLLSGHIPQPVQEPTDESFVKAQIDKVIVNEKLLKELDLGSPQEAVGKRFWWGGDTEIAGVVADFNLEPLKYAIAPALIYQDKEIYSHASIKMEPSADIQKTLASVETVWKGQFQDGVYEYTFVDNQIDAYYKSENRLYTLFRIFAGLAILISCLGLWGLVTYASQQRTKEIGIRKVLGASVKAILILLTRDFLVMVFIAFVVASPLTYYFMQDWLSNFAFHIDIEWGTFVIAGITLITVALLTVSIQTMKAALTNPIKSLKAE
jgi:putative ABC transport system permease protein